MSAPRGLYQMCVKLLHGRKASHGAGEVPLVIGSHSAQRASLSRRTDDRQRPQDPPGARQEGSFPRGLPRRWKNRVSLQEGASNVEENKVENRKVCNGKHFACTCSAPSRVSPAPHKLRGRPAVLAPEGPTPAGTSSGRHPPRRRDWWSSLP
eukprot:scaffold184_cov316-Pinguiococcus_pyrenoidosus.AAC.10